MNKLKDALSINKDYSFGAAFDLELQEKKRLQKLAEKEIKRKEEKRVKKEAKREKERQMLQMQLKQIEGLVEKPKEIEKVAKPDIKNDKRKRSRSRENCDDHKIFLKFL